MNKDKRLHQIFLGLSLVVLIWSGIKPHDYLTWMLEVTPAIIAFIILYLTYNRFRFSNLVYFLIMVHCMILMVGGHWTYAEVPLFNYLRDIGWFARNNYDKIGHFAQGFVPALVAREILLRKTPLQKGGLLNFLSVSVPVAFSALYEIVEWWVSVLTGSKGDSFLGTQGYIWDTQSDMLICTIGSIVAIILLSKLHDKSMKKLGGPA
jgi:putative membrane protein